MQGFAPASAAHLIDRLLFPIEATSSGDRGTRAGGGYDGMYLLSTAALSQSTLGLYWQREGKRYLIRERGKPTAIPAMYAMSSMAGMVTLEASLDLTEEKAEKTSLSKETGEACGRLTNRRFV